MSAQLEIPCLGRPFNLGMLYDCRTEKLIPGITLWDAKKLKSFSQVKRQPSSSYQIISEDTIDTKSVSLGIDANLKLSFLGGLVTVDGAAKYLRDTRSSVKQSRVTLQYKSTTHFEQLTMDQIGDIQYPDVLADQDATHVVTGITYGADAFFVFDRTVSEGETMNDVHGNMEVAVKAIPSITGNISGDGSLNIHDTVKMKTNKFHCTFHGDLILSSNPSTFNEAIKLYKELPKLLNGETGSVPKVVYLSALTKMSGANQIRQSIIPYDLISQVEEIMEHLHGTEMHINDLQKHDMCSKFVNIKAQLDKTKTFLTRFKMSFVKKLSQLLPKVRSTEVKVEKLATLISSVKESPFSSSEMEKYLMGKDREIKQLAQYLLNMEKVSNIQFDFPDTTCDLTTLLINDEFEYVVCFAFNVTREASANLQKFEHYLQTRKVKFTNEKEWFLDQSFTSELRAKSRKFIDFAKENSDGNSIAFVVTSSNKEINESGPSIVLYVNGAPTQFDPPGSPGIPQATKVTMNSIEIAWNAPPHGSVVLYQVLCTPCDNSSGIRTFSTTSTSYDVPGLQSGKKYFFQIKAIGESGFATKSVTNQIATDSTARLVKEFLLSAKCIDSGGSATNPGPPVYQLPLKLVDESKEDLIRKYEITLPSTPISALSKPEKVLMLLGATGAGKSTLLNGLANYLLGVRWKDNFRFKIVSGEGKKSQADSQTTYIIAYCFRCINNADFNLTVVDTPGFGDSDGINRDRIIVHQIKKFFSGEENYSIDVLHGIGFVTQASLARLTPTQKYIFDSVLSIFGKDISDNIFLMATFADAAVPPVIESVKVAKIPYKSHFKFNNSALFAAINESAFNELFWNMGCTSFKEFFNSFSVAEAKSLKLTREVLNERELCERLIPELQDQVRIGMAKMDEIQQEERILKQHEADINANKDFTYKVDVIKFKKVELEPGIHTTTCNICNYTCHRNCTRSDNKDKIKCCVMRDGCCKICPSQCPWYDHVNVPYIFEYYEDEEARTSHDLKKMYDIASSEKERAEAMIAENEELLLDTYAAVHLLIQRTHRSIKRLQEIALKPNPLTELDYLDMLIKTEEIEASSGWKKRVKQYREFRKDAELYQKVAIDRVDSADLLLPPDIRETWRKRIHKFLKLRTYQNSHSKTTVQLHRQPIFWWQRLFGKSKDQINAPKKPTAAH